LSSFCMMGRVSEVLCGKLMIHSTVLRTSKP
jgi:hypothetical protein